MVTEAEAKGVVVMDFVDLGNVLLLLYIGSTMVFSPLTLTN